MMAFLGGPLIDSIYEANRLGISLDDFAVFDQAKDLIFVNDAKKVNSNKIESEMSTSRADKVG